MDKAVKRGLSFNLDELSSRLKMLIRDCKGQGSIPADRNFTMMGS